MKSNRKRHKSNISSASSSQAHQTNLTQTTNTNEPRESDSILEDAIPSPSSTQLLSGPTPEADEASKASDTKALNKALKLAGDALSTTYKSYMPPELSDQRDKRGNRMISFRCKICGTSINRPTSDSSCGNLKKHASNCYRKLTESTSNRSLAEMGIKGTGDINPAEVNQLCAIWCAEAARPFSALVDASHQAILHPTIKKLLPGRRVVSKDIQMIYLAIQQNYKAVLNAHKGALYLGVDAWQSPNGFDILGAFIYRLVEDNSGGSKLEALPLDFIQLAQSHTGEYLARVVTLVVEKFGIQDKVSPIVMVNELKKRKWVRFKGEPQWIRCFAHVLNLIVQGILRPFGSQKNSKAHNETTTAPDDSDDSSSEAGDFEEHVPKITQAGDDSDSSSDNEEDESGDELDENNQEETEFLSLEDIENASDEEESDTYTTTGCKQTLAKFRAVAKKLRYSPNSKIEFVQVCREKGCQTPHNIERDVRTRWNSTNAQLRSIIRCEAAMWANLFINQ
ncbi:hypothetical protein PGTUg99_024465 [Puccinia graminis f. sp. tritici]|uniref:hAT-like transposase RNase-H fold domain-containing protein n=2 Tax=Puccinia graminis f. sp. tritici TaxID=56615 RepID=A0A5B0SD67_PUCGR|nr:hypothetical protein PGTUg99_024465 [Puccinia graminis f. sp. tritici]